MTTSFSSLAAALQAAPPPVSPCETPRFVQSGKDGSETLLDPQRRPLWTRRSRNARAERVDTSTRLPNATAIRDLWNGGNSPAVDEVSAWAVRDVLRLWRLWPEG